MIKYLFFCLSLLTSLTLLSQHPGNQTLFVIDSIPILADPEPWNELLSDDVADLQVISDKDSLRKLGWEAMSAVTYIFTKAYRGRPDSIKKIPRLHQMVLKDGSWSLNDFPYSGIYIDYYNNGHVQNQGSLLNGKMDGELIVYYKNGVTKSTAAYQAGAKHGVFRDYAPNGVLIAMQEYENNKSIRRGESYFSNGQVKYELRPKNTTKFDTSVEYYSTGKVKKIQVTKSRQYYPDKKQQDLDYYNSMFYQYERSGDIKKMNDCMYHIRQFDSLSSDTYFREGVLFAKEFRFDRAIAAFDRVLLLEPLMLQAYQQRAFARVKKDKFSKRRPTEADRKNDQVEPGDLSQMPEGERAKVCADVQRADELDGGLYNSSKPEAALVIRRYCRNK